VAVLTFTRIAAGSTALSAPLTSGATPCGWTVLTVPWLERLPQAGADLILTDSASGGSGGDTGGSSGGGGFKCGIGGGIQALLLALFLCLRLRRVAGPWKRSTLLNSTHAIRSSQRAANIADMTFTLRDWQMLDISQGVVANEPLTITSAQPIFVIDLQS